MLTDLDYELLSAYIDGALTDSERAAFELRLQAEPELSRELDELRATVTLLNNLPPRKAPRDFTLDARYARRSTFFFTSATFSALSTAAAIILFALGAYLFTDSKSPAASSAAVGQVAQSALLPTSTGTILDKSAATTATELESMNEIAVTTTIENSSSVTTGLAASGGIGQESATSEGYQADQLPLPQATGRPDDGILSDLSPIVPSPPDSQGRTSEATETIANQQYAAPSSSNGDGNAAPPSPAEETEIDSSAASVFAATQPPFTATRESSVTSVPTATVTPTASPAPTLRPQATVTLVPSATSTSTYTLTPRFTVTQLSTEPPQPPAPTMSDALDFWPLILIGLGIVLLMVAVVTTLIRRRNRS